MGPRGICKNKNHKNRENQPTICERLYAYSTQCPPQISWACQSYMLSFVKFNTICRKNIENLCLVQITLVPKTVVASNK